MRNLCAAFLVAALVTSSAYAASSNEGALAPGKPAGVTSAQSSSTVAAILAGTAAFAMILALASGSGGGSGGNSNSNNNGTGGGTTTTTTST